ncbi:hypothetical protein DCS_06752 [Drechmeria coniospora]|uniref:Uncharacterized protein n=1 Tax=Drechmeria coniospora TaxID=98403 RepID=A0A151GCF2_DRECN|nr:hypothetical protein DCS_06752 [Drechmeria coniospora]KYK54792.1 hypothetical protein DCS_06752 [Drechmeria coniospora]
MEETTRTVKDNDAGCCPPTWAHGRKEASGWACSFRREDEEQYDRSDQYILMTSLSMPSDRSTSRDMVLAEDGEGAD